MFVPSSVYWTSATIQERRKRKRNVISYGVRISSTILVRFKISGPPASQAWGHILDRCSKDEKKKDLCQNKRNAALNLLPRVSQPFAPGIMWPEKLMPVSERTIFYTVQWAIYSRLMWACSSQRLSAAGPASLKTWHRPVGGKLPFKGLSVQIYI